MRTSVCYAGRSEIGQRRASNQDQFLIAELTTTLRVFTNTLGMGDQSQLQAAHPWGYLLVVADGMGGHQGGNRASEIAVQQMVAQVAYELADVQRRDQESHAMMEDRLRKMVGVTHRAILDEATSNRQFHDMGTTLTTALILESDLWIAHVGDSRCYLIRGDRLERLTQDHTVANQIATRGGISVSILENSPWSNVLWNALGAGAEQVRPDIRHVTLEAGDRILLCSDGLCKHVSDLEILKTVFAMTNPQEICDHLVELANTAGGSDNITVLVGAMAIVEATTEEVRLLSPGDESSFLVLPVATTRSLEDTDTFSGVEEKVEDTHDKNDA